MKICPQCNVSYEDSMFFCLEDGTPLKSIDNSVQSNPATFENTLVIPTDEKTLDLPAQNELTEGKTLALISETPTEQNSVKTEFWQPETISQRAIPTSNTNQGVLSSYVESNQKGSNGKFFIIGGLLGGIALLGTALGGWWLMQKPSDEVVVANVNKSSENSNNNLGLSNANLSVAFGEDISNTTNTNLSINNNKSTTKPSPTTTKDQKNTPTPTPTTNQTPESTPPPQPTPIPKTPTPTPIPTPIPTRNPPNKIVSGGVVNGKAVNLVRPTYPAAAKAVRASGAVSVQVLIDESGNVVRASAVSGHPLLRSAAEQAARSSKFSPTVLGGQAVKVTGVVVYNFIP